MCDLTTLSNFIVLEGLDGSGTTTQWELCRQRLRQAAIPRFCTVEPTQDAIGCLIRDILARKRAAHPETIALLFAADRKQHLYEPHTGILARHEQGHVIVSDRYLFSSLAYQSVECDFDFVYALNSRFPLPSHVIFVDTPISVCKERWQGRDQHELFESEQFQARVLAGYHRAFAMYESSPMAIHHVDGSKSTKVIAEEVWKVMRLLPIVSM